KSFAQELALPLEGWLHLGELTLSGRQVCLRRAQRILRVLRLQPGDDLSRRHRLADVGIALHEPAIDAEGEIDGVLRRHLTGQGDRLAGSRVPNDDRPYRADRSFGLRCFITGDEQQWQEQQGLAERWRHQALWVLSRNFWLLRLTRVD